MNDKTIEQAKSAELRGSWQAMQRAAQRARELAIQTDTCLVISQNGVIQRIKPETETTVHRMQEPPPSYKGKP